jgi:hypothetical protein
MFVRQLTGLPAPDPDSDGDEDVAPDAEDGDDTDPAVTTDAPARQPTATAKELRLF